MEFQGFISDLSRNFLAASDMKEFVGKGAVTVRVFQGTHEPFTYLCLRLRDDS